MGQYETYETWKSVVFGAILGHPGWIFLAKWPWFRSRAPGLRLLGIWCSLGWERHHNPVLGWTISMNDRWKGDGVWFWGWFWWSNNFFWLWVLFSGCQNRESVMATNKGGRSATHTHTRVDQQMIKSSRSTRNCSSNIQQLSNQLSSEYIYMDRKSDACTGPKLWSVVKPLP